MSVGGGHEEAMLGRGAGGDEGIGGKFLGKTVRFMGGFFAGGEGKEVEGVEDMSNEEREMERRLGGFGQELPKAWKVLGNELDADVLRGCKRVVVVGVHGWFPGTIVRTVMGEVCLLSLSFFFTT